MTDSRVLRVRRQSPCGLLPATDRFCACGRGEARTTVPARQTGSHTPYRSFLRQSVPHGTRSPAAQIFRCSVLRRISCPQDKKTCGSRTLRGSFLHKRSSGALAASFSFFFFPQRKRTSFPFPKGGKVSFSCSLGKRTKRMRDRSGRSDLCKRFAFTRCSRHVFAQASLCKPRRQGKAESGFIPVCSFLCVFSLSQCNASHCRANMQRGRRLRLIAPTPPARGDFAVFAHESGAFDKKSPLPKTRKALLLGGLSLIQNITVPAAFPSHIRRTLRRSRPYRVP